MGFIPDFEEKNMECNITSKSGGLKIDADPILLGRAFENIISNTIKYASEGKYLNIVIDVNVTSSKKVTRFDIILPL